MINEVASGMGNVENKSSTSNPSVNMQHPSLNDLPSDAANAPLLLKHDASGSSTESHAGEDHKYEEFAKKLKITCPTCQGKGKLSQNQADSMVALIPVRDKRLRPRKTKLYLGLTIIIAVIAIFLIAFFLLPRSIGITIVDIKVTKIFMPDDSLSTPYIDVAITYAINNQNFFKASVTNVMTDISWNKFVLNTTKTPQHLSVSGRKTENSTYTSRQVFSGEDIQRRVKMVCATGWNWQLFEKFVTSATVSYLSRSEEVTNTYYGYTECHNTSSLIFN